MKVNYECASCMLRQSREAIEHAVEANDKRMDVSLKVLEFMEKHFKKDSNSNKLGTDLHHMIMKETKNNDPYKQLRELGNYLDNILVGRLEVMFIEYPSFENYVKIAVAGNIIDFGALEESTNMEELIKEQLKRQPSINHIDKLDKALQTAKTVLYLADNCCEIVFDKLLIEKIKEDYNLEIILALKENPILNDALLSDAEDLELDKYTKLITTGAASVGVVEDYVSDELIELLHSCDVVISKGMGNYEGLTEININRSVFFLLNTKCQAISDEIGVGLRSSVIIKKDL